MHASPAITEKGPVHQAGNQVHVNRLAVAGKLPGGRVAIAARSHLLGTIAQRRYSGHNQEEAQEVPHEAIGFGFLVAGEALSVAISSACISFPLAIF
jgi:hypothetical protein